MEKKYIHSKPWTAKNTIRILWPRAMNGIQWEHWRAEGMLNYYKLHNFVQIPVPTHATSWQHGLSLIEAQLLWANKTFVFLFLCWRTSMPKYQAYKWDQFCKISFTKIKTFYTPKLTPMRQKQYRLWLRLTIERVKRVLKAATFTAAEIPHFISTRKYGTCISTKTQPCLP